MKTLTYFVIAVVIFLSSCTAPSKEKPENLIEKDKLVEILTDIHLADAYLESRSLTDLKIAKDSASYYTFLYKKHNISRGQFVETMNYYSEYPAELEGVYEQVMAILKESLEKNKAVE